jgi:hypothetical protein
MKPRRNYRTRPKKTGAKKRQKVLAQEKRLVALGHDKKKLDKMTIVDIRNLLKKAMKKKRKPVKRKTTKKTASK